MFNTYLGYLCPLLVLTAGLISCAPDSKTKPIYVAPAPKILRANGSIELPNWDQSGRRELDIQDKIDVSAAHASKAQIATYCHSGGLTSQWRPEILNPGVIEIYQTLPGEVLATDLKRQRTNCNFTLTLFNSEGSKHIYPLAYVELTDQRVPRAFVQRDGAPLPALGERLQLAQLNGVKLRDSGGGKGHAGLICSDGRSPLIPFESVTDFSNFDYDHFETYPNRIRGIFESKPLQMCRAVVIEKNLITAMTPLFELQLPRPGLRIKTLQLPFRTISIQVEAVSALTQGRGLHAGDYQIENPSAVPRILRISRRPSLVQVSFVDSGRPGETKSVIRPFMFLTPLAPPHLITVEKDSVLVTIPAQQSMRLSADIKAPPLRACSLNAHVLTVDMPQMATLEEITETGAVLNSVTFELGPRIQIGGPGLQGMPNSVQGVINESSLCSW